MKKLETSLFGPWALVTGASSGIGEEFALQLAQLGFNLVLVARRHEKLQELGQRLSTRYNIDFRVLKADLIESNSVDRIIESTQDIEIGLLISNAGTGKPASFLKSNIQEILSIIELNSVSHVRLVHHFGNLMAKRGKGGILLTGAMGATGGLPYMANEAGTKSYILSLGKGLHGEFKKKGIHITVLETSPTETPVLAKLGFNDNSLPVKPLPVALCVSESLDALSRNSMTIVPGFKFKLMNALTPPFLSRKMMGRVLEKTAG